MGNIIDHAAEYQYTFDERPFSDVDSLVLCQLAYIHYEDLGMQTPEERRTLQELSQKLCPADSPEGIPVRKSERLLHYAGKNPRFMHIVAWHYVSLFQAEEEKQFAAITFLIDEELSYIAFRGTDNSWVGWKENFNMVVMPVVPSHAEAMRYLDGAARQLDGQLLIGGHSKGGNIAVYAAAHVDADIRQRIRSVYNYDGPGFFKEFYQCDGYPAIQDRICKTVPEFSVVGMLLAQQNGHSVIKSSESGINQHDPMSWTVSDGAYVSCGGIDRKARLISNSLNLRIYAMSMEQRRAFIDAFFELVRISGASSLEELAATIAARGPAVEEVIADMPLNQKTRFLAILRIFGMIFEQRMA